MGFGGGGWFILYGGVIRDMYCSLYVTIEWASDSWMYSAVSGMVICRVLVGLLAMQDGLCYPVMEFGDIGLFYVPCREF
jgi:hypothetical protein